MPSDIDPILIDLGTIRDQGMRPTCLSFAISDVHRWRLDIDELLSPESLHRAAALRHGTSMNEAVATSAALTALELDGQTTELYWPYNTEACLHLSAPFFKRAASPKPFNSSDAATMLRNNGVMIALLNIGKEFFVLNDTNQLEEEDILPIEGCHAVVVNGTEVRGAKRYFRLRNSWGGEWGMDGQIWASAPYLTQRCFTVLQLN